MNYKEMAALYGAVSLETGPSLLDNFMKALVAKAYKILGTSREEDYCDGVMDRCPSLQEALLKWEPSPRDLIGFGLFYERLFSLNREKRKKTGSFYTPPEIVDYLVQKSMGKAFGRSVPNKDLRILDPCCGGGAFLVGALCYLLQRGVPVKRALSFLNGIDTDPLAVEVTRISLLAACQLLELPDESKAVLVENLRQIVTKNINHQDFFGLEQEKKFEVVLGNPPYVANKKLSPELKKEIAGACRYLGRQYDLSLPFLEKGLNHLVPGGRLAYITSNKYLAADYGAKLRGYLLDSFVLEEIIDVSHLPVFRGAHAYPVMQVIFRGKKGETTVGKVRNLEELGVRANPGDTDYAQRVQVRQDFFRILPGQRIALLEDRESYEILRKIENRKGPRPFSRIKCGIATSGFNRSVIDEEAYHALGGEMKKKFKPLLSAGDIAPYKAVPTGNYIHRKASGDSLWGSFSGARLVLPGMAKRLKCAMIQGNEALGRVYFIKSEDCFVAPVLLMAYLNSSAAAFYYRGVFGAAHLAGGFLRVNGSYIEDMAYPDFTAIPKEGIEALLQKASRLLEREGQTDDAGDMAAIDIVFYRYFGLSDKEIGIIQRQLTENGGPYFD